MSNSTFDVAKRLDFSIKTLDRILSFVQRADSRAQVLLGISVAMFFILAINIPTFHGPWWATLSYLSAIAMLGMSIYKIYLVFYPQLRGPEGSLIYFQEIIKLAQSEFVDRSIAATPEQFLRDVLVQSWRNSEIVASKFRHLRSAMLWTVGALPFWVISLAYDAVTKGSVTLE